jgi:hypothetical protein
MFGDAAMYDNPQSVGSRFHPNDPTSLPVMLNVPLTEAVDTGAWDDKLKSAPESKVI